jgi:hypothetical protein
MTATDPIVFLEIGVDLNRAAPAASSLRSVTSWVRSLFYMGTCGLYRRQDRAR